ncbi:MAG: hypothetical protein MK137_00535 [Rickettsiales bacterium]|nr:hypothetical protein [Rickettsiales bacterium]
MKFIIEALSKFLPINKDDGADENANNKKSPLCFSVFESGLKTWERQNDETAPVWLNFHKPDDAAVAIEELKKIYKIKNTQILGAVVIVKGEDVIKIIKIIRKMEMEKIVQLEIYKAINHWREDNPNRSEETTFSMRFENSSKALIARRCLFETYKITSIKIQGETLSMKSRLADQFCYAFEKIHLESTYGN